jgi:hypothetical protein
VGGKTNDDKIDAWIERAEACVGKLEVDREKSNAVAEHQEDPKKEAAVEMIGALDDRFKNRHLAVRRADSRETDPGR